MMLCSFGKYHCFGGAFCLHFVHRKLGGGGGGWGGWGRWSGSVLLQDVGTRFTDYKLS